MSLSEDIIADVKELSSMLGFPYSKDHKQLRTCF